MILFDVDGTIACYVAIARYRSVRVRGKYKHDSQDFLRMFITHQLMFAVLKLVCMHTYKYSLFLTALMFQNLLQLTTRQGKKIYIR